MNLVTDSKCYLNEAWSLRSFLKRKAEQSKPSDSYLKVGAKCGLGVDSRGLQSCTRFAEQKTLISNSITVTVKFSFRSISVMKNTSSFLSLQPRAQTYRHHLRSPGCVPLGGNQVSLVLSGQVAAKEISLHSSWF